MDCTAHVSDCCCHQCVDISLRMRLVCTVPLQHLAWVMPKLQQNYKSAAQSRQVLRSCHTCLPACSCTAQLGDIVSLVRGELPDLARATLSALVVMDVHARDVVAQLAAEGIEGQASHFSWLSQLRMYWEVGALYVHRHPLHLIAARPHLRHLHKDKGLLGACFAIDWWIMTWTVLGGCQASRCMQAICCCHSLPTPSATADTPLVHCGLHCWIRCHQSHASTADISLVTAVPCRTRPPTLAARR
jgi:hypothetical protein